MVKPASKRTAVEKRKQDGAEIARLKDEFIKYFEDVPVQKYAGMFIGRSESQIIRWMKEDVVFANRVEEARAKWVRKKATRVKAEFALERLEKDIWAERKEVTGKDGGPIELKPVEVMQVMPSTTEASHGHLGQAESDS